MKSQTAQSLPIIAIVGRPNVGKSSLFNRLIDKRKAIISDEAGTTRDPIYHRTMLRDMEVIMVDTGGVEFGDKENIEADIQTQARLALAEANIILFVVDAQEEPTVDDFEAAKILRKSSKDLIFVANKCDNSKIREGLIDFFKLGFDEPIRASVIHNIGIEEIKSKLSQKVEAQGWKQPVKAEKRSERIKIALVGRPNVGKSSLTNSLLGEKKVIVADAPGTTRDAIDVDLHFGKQDFTLIDTAGIRRRGRIEKGIEKFSTFRSLEAIERCDVACLVIDFSIGVRSQDTHIASYILDASKGLILVINKCDLMKDKERDETRMLNILRHRFDFLPWAPVIFTSALDKININQIYKLSQQIHDERFRRIQAIELDHFLTEVTMKHQAPTVGRTKIKFSSIVQASVNPPTFDIYTNFPEKLHFSYKRYLENNLREQFGFTGTAVRIFYSRRPREERKKHNIKEDKENY